MDSPDAAVRAYFDALNAADRDGIVATFRDDGSLIAHGMPAATGRPELERIFDRIFSAMRFDRELHVERVDADGDLASALTHTTGTVTLLAKDAVVPGVSRELFVLRRSGGDWRILHYLFNHPETGAG